MKSHKNLFFAVLAAALFAQPVFAGSTKRCGLGSKLFGHSKSIISQLSEIGTDALFMENMSISSGTSGCHHNGNLLFEPLGKNDHLEDQLLYANANFEELVVEMAAGFGETLSGFASTFGCGSDSSGEFGAMVKSRYSRIMNRQEISPEEMLNNVRETFRSTPPVREKCGAA